MTCVNEGKIPITSRLPDSSVSSVRHANGTAVKNLAKIEALMSTGGDVRFIPRDIKKWFPNIKILLIRSGGLLSVTKEDLKQFGTELRGADFWNSSITSIGADLFKYNSNLVTINFHMNPLRYIEPKFFENLKKLEKIVWVSFDSANCINQGMTESNSVLTFNWNHGCFSESSRIDYSLLLTVNERIEHCRLENDCLKDKFEKQLNSLRNSVKTLIKDNKELKYTVKTLLRETRSLGN